MAHGEEHNFHIQIITRENSINPIFLNAISQSSVGD